MQALLMLIVGFSMPGGFEWVVILIAILLVFGGKKIPELMKGLGKGVKGFKDGLKGLEDEINTDDSKERK
ncbi:MAG: twin-arginine translocase TatA/TatE family subunit [Candidatus Symbiothrix sp.]|jgi:sec-independent protein translocase protein TatA|nr:twin-arginine translocase TatA/TatE family subunit [Candidatus Symbiothrix sp.]